MLDLFMKHVIVFNTVYSSFFSHYDRQNCKQKERQLESNSCCKASALTTPPTHGPDGLVCTLNYLCYVFNIH